MPFVTSLIHMAFVAAGRVVDAGAPLYALLLGVLLLPISIALAWAGSVLGAWLKKYR